MTKHYNTSIIEDANRIFNTKSNDNISNEIMPNIQPVVQISRYANISKVGVALNATATTIWTVPADKDFYLTSASLSLIKDATSTSISTRIIATIDGVGIRLLSIESLTLTPQSDNVSISFDYPVKLDRGTVIQVTNSTNVANITASACITGYTVETTRGV